MKKLWAVKALLPGLIVETLRDRGVTPGCVIDECGGVSKGNRMGYEGMIASIVVAEKGYADFQLYVEHKGGHSSVPPKDSAMKLLAQAIIAVEENQFPYRITESVKANVEASAQLSDDEKSLLLRDVEGNWDKLLPIIKEDPFLSALFHTTTAITMASVPNRQISSRRKHRSSSTAVHWKAIHWKFFRNTLKISFPRASKSVWSKAAILPGLPSSILMATT